MRRMASVSALVEAAKWAMAHSAVFESAMRKAAESVSKLAETFTAHIHPRLPRKTKKAFRKALDGRTLAQGDKRRIASARARNKLIFLDGDYI